MDELRRFIFGRLGRSVDHLLARRQTATASCVHRSSASTHRCRPSGVQSPTLPRSSSRRSGYDTAATRRRQLGYPAGHSLPRQPVCVKRQWSINPLHNINVLFIHTIHFSRVCYNRYSLYWTAEHLHAARLYFIDIIPRQDNRNRQMHYKIPVFHRKWQCGEPVPRDAMRAWYMVELCGVCHSVSPSICPSQADIVSKQQNISS